MKLCEDTFDGLAWIVRFGLLVFLFFSNVLVILFFRFSHISTTVPVGDKVPPSHTYIADQKLIFSEINAEVRRSS